MKSQETNSAQKLEHQEESSSSQQPQDEKRIDYENKLQISDEEVDFDFPLADSISTTTLVNLLVRKGIISIEEFLEEESKNLAIEDALENSPDGQRQIKKVRHKRSRRWHTLKRWMSRKRWSRKLGTLLFGWRWKKVKTDIHK